MHHKTGLIFALLALFLAAPAQASDYAKESRWADQILDGLFDGEPVWLEADGHRFLSIWTPAKNNPKGAAILLHGTGVHPDWPQVISPLRTALPDQGWSTLSLQMPVLGATATMNDYAAELDEADARIDAAVEYLQSRKVKKIILIGHSLGAAMGSHYLAQRPASPIQVFVGLGMGDSRIDALNNAKNLAKTTRPVVDVYGENDLPNVVASAKQRKAARKSTGTLYKQVEIKDTDHFFTGHEQEAIDDVVKWANFMLGDVEPWYPSH
ncbi:MAG: DUF3530 domain-containing protein [Gammaproteobacteria bacterium]|nr:MAG: DUF3530 domain-containing protein [Gammaproteobacteria bacterium]RTZ60710.1 MAG: DUF3530 domain-containing protein [Gammaproteobacteria bacterium]